MVVLRKMTKVLMMLLLESATSKKVKIGGRCNNFTPEAEKD